MKLKVEELTKASIRTIQNRENDSVRKAPQNRTVELKPTLQMNRESQEIWTSHLSQAEPSEPIDAQSFISTGSKRYERANKLSFPVPVILSVFNMGGRRGDAYFLSKLPEDVPPEKYQSVVSNIVVRCHAKAFTEMKLQ